MKSIVYIVPYFGKLPNNFEMWLKGCEFNSTIDWIIFTDDKTQYKYPKNVKVNYCSFDEIKKRIQNLYEFEIALDRPWKLCDYRPAYGEIFAEDIKDYDFWGYCDVDLMWGNIRKFITEDILDKYNKVGFQGHSTLYRNNRDIITIYRKEIDGITNYKQVFTSTEGYCFDENIISDIFESMDIPYYREVNFAHLNKYEKSFYLGHLPRTEDYKNEKQVFTWNRGKLLRHYLYKEKVFNEEFMYIHFFCRPIKYKLKSHSEIQSYIIYKDNVEQKEVDINEKFIKKYGSQSKIKFIIKTIYYNRKKITLRRIIINLKNFIRYKNR